MLDQEIYKELGQYLYNVAPNVEENINVFFIRRSESDLEIRLWMGDVFDGNKAFRVLLTR